jgi:hypothetical protein
MPARSILAVLTDLADGKISHERALRRILRIKEQEQRQREVLHRKFFSCLTIRIRRTNQRGLALKIPLGLANLVLSLVSLNPKLRARLRDEGIRWQDIHKLIRFLKYREAGFDIKIEANDGTKVLVHN